MDALLNPTAFVDLEEAGEESANPNMMRYRTRGKIERYDWYDISNAACEPFGFYFGDRVKVLRWSKEKNMNKEKEAWVIGVLNGNLYFHVDGDNGASKWSNMKKADFQSKGFRLIRRNEAGVSSARSSPPPYNAPDLGQLLNESEPQQFYDVTFKLGGNADGNVSDNEDADKDTGATPGGVLVHAHRCILSARSQYFRAMLKNGMKESSASVITIQDIDEEAFRCVLQFLYTGHVNITQDNYGKLLVSASRFQLDELLRFCYSQLTSVLTVKNVTELLSIATSHTHLSELKQRCMEYVLENYSTLLAEGSLTHLMKENNEIMVEILHQLQPTALKRKSSSSSSSSSTTASPGATSAGTGETGAKFPRW